MNRFLFVIVVAVLGLAGCGSSSTSSYSSEGKGLVIPTGLTDFEALKSLIDAADVNARLVSTFDGSGSTTPVEGSWYANGDFTMNAGAHSEMSVGGSYFVRDGSGDWYVVGATDASSDTSTKLSDLLLRTYNDTKVSETPTGYKIFDGSDSSQYLELVVDAKRRLVGINESTGDSAINTVITYPSSLPKIEAPKDAKPASAVGGSEFGVDTSS